MNVRPHLGTAAARVYEVLVNRHPGEVPPLLIAIGNDEQIDAVMLDPNAPDMHHMTMPTRDELLAPAVKLSELAAALED